MKSLLKIFLKHVYIYSGVIVIILIGIYFLLFHHKTTYQFVTVERGPITESVSLTGNTTPAQSVSLTFGSSGIVSNTYSDLGKKVHTGQVLAELNMSDLLAQLHNAQAGLTIAKQNASSSKNNVAYVIAEQDSLVASAWQTLHSNLAAIPKDASNLNTPPTISGSYNGTVDGSYILSVYSAGGPSGAAFNYSGLESGTESVTTAADEPLGTHGLFIRFPGSASGNSSITGGVWTVDIPNTRWSGYANALAVYQTALVTRDKAIADAEANTGTNDSSSSVADAQIAQAQAGVDSAMAKIQNAEIIAPISGTITQFDAKVGQLASPGTPLISIISNTGYEVDAGLSETDVGKVSIGDTATMTLDAFPNQTFAGTVFYIAPSETNSQGVISYQVKISFDKLDPQLKSGLTANIDIETNYKDNVLILPQYAILQNDQGTFVETLENNKVKQTPVTLGIQDEKGNVEVISGVTEGEQVLNIGLKS